MPACSYIHVSLAKQQTINHDCFDLGAKCESQLTTVKLAKIPKQLEQNTNGPGGKRNETKIKTSSVKRAPTAQENAPLRGRRLRDPRFRDLNLAAKCSRPVGSSSRFRASLGLLEWPD
ncbi:hypothetical protein TESG_00039 [Trichophyton tonsurans CBS 112818]|uniref:Uncharacterized protein n=1 Tax=Trichophyton tonsurans (strain CBS 112818) TaxID=647933 RepID=F2RMB5_TRIT1|nr:hypothetical protein TESG_00039 [Trichophyton tonsurans CBS 112818]